MNIILLGSPASGKGTQAELLAKKLNLYLLQTGELSRKLAKTDPEIKKIYDAGKLIPAELMTMHVINFLSKEKPDLENILFEGFPRFISQYEALEKFLKNKGDDIDAVISLDVTEKVAIKRISSRRICKKCGEVYNLITKPPKGKKCDVCGGVLFQRSDDKPKAIKVRFDYYKNNTKELIDYLNKKRVLIKVDGERSIEVIFRDILEKLGVKNG
jgi:adenylate kinase